MPGLSIRGLNPLARTNTSCNSFFNGYCGCGTTDSNAALLDTAAAEDWALVALPFQTNEEPEKSVRAHFQRGPSNAIHYVKTKHL
jgi:hypothetical protein